MQSLYRQEELSPARAAQKRAAAAMLIVAAVGLVLCVLFCAFTTRRNQSVTRLLTIGASILAGWIVIFLSHSRYDGAQAQARHVELMLSGPRERYAGRFQMLEGVFQVKKGVAIRKVRLREELHDTLLTVAEDRAARLPKEFSGVVETVYDCIVAYREDDA